MSTPSTSAVRLAIAVRNARQRMQDAAMVLAEPIAIVGMSCRLPGDCSTPTRFWDFLCSRGDGVIDLPRDRWAPIGISARVRGGFLTDPGSFDHEFFDIPASEAERMDPQQRLLLETAYEALWSAGIDPTELAGTSTAVFASVFNPEYLLEQANQPALANAYTATGVSPAIASARIAYTLDLKGPCLTLDTACSSSLAAIHLACRSLRVGECDTAIVGAASIRNGPEGYLWLSRMGMLAPDGRSKTFDRAANGFVPGEGGGVVVLKRLGDALAEGYPVRAVLRGSAMNQDGRTTVLTAPSGLSQLDLIRRALQDARVSPHEIGFVETHGTGTALGDPIEFEALKDALGPHGGDAQPCWLGAVKTNIGHLEAAAGIAGLVKVALALENEAIPPNLHFVEPNSAIALDQTRFRIPVETVAWPRGERIRFAGVSGFGFGGTNVHLVVEEPPAGWTPRRKPIPPRAWQREHHWFSGSRGSVAQPVPHFLLSRELESPLLKAKTYEAELGSARDAWMHHHRVDGEPILPAAAILELFRASANCSALEDVSFDEAVALPASIQVTVSGQIVELWVREENNWRRCAGAKVAPARATPPGETLDSIRSRLSSPEVPAPFYQQLDSIGMAMGESFRVLGELRIGRNEALARQDAPVGRQRRITLLDGALQSLAVAAGPLDTLYVPAGIERIEWDGTGEFAWCHGLVRRFDAEVLQGSVRAMRESGETVCAVSGLRMRPWKRAEPSVHQLEWREAALASGTPALGRWLILADQRGYGAELARALEQRGSQVVSVSFPEHWHRALDDGEWAGIAHLWNLDLQDTETALYPGCGTVLEVLQRIAVSSGIRPRLCVVTAGAQATTEGAPVSPSQKAVWGLLRAARREHPGLGLTSIDLNADLGDVNAAADELLHESAEAEVAFRGGKRLTPRLAQRPLQPNVGLSIAPDGSLDKLSWTVRNRRRPGPGQVEIRVESAGINFRDVLMALGLYPGPPNPLGSECAGRIVRVGDGVPDLAEGDPVVALASGSLGTHITAPAHFVARRPAGLAPGVAAGIGVVAVTVLYALDRVARLKRGERILIHAAAGGVGLAAVEWAHRQGAIVYATAGSEVKRDSVRKLGVEWVGDSRSTGFGQAIREATGGAGVDVVLNSLTGDMIAESLMLLAPGGRFIELGKRGVWDVSRARDARPDVRYEIVDWSQTAATDPEIVQQIFREGIDEAARGLWNLPTRNFGMEAAAEAFRFMAQARHTGKIVVDFPSRGIPLRRDGAYLISGGMGALGLATAEWMARRGAGVLALAGRREPGTAAQAAIRRMEAVGARVLVQCTDISDASQVNALVQALRDQGLPLRGVVHAAGTLDDGVLEQQNWARFERVMHGKVRGAYCLHEATRQDPLDFFIAYSSVAGLLGSPGQANYSAANESLSGLMEYRRALGLPALAIDWGPWQGAGMAVRIEERTASAFARSMVPMTHGEALDLMDQVFVQGFSRAAVLTPKGGSSVIQPAPTVATINGSPVAERLRSSPSPLRQQILIDYLSGEAKRILEWGQAALDPDQPLFEAGLDSLMSVEFRNVVSAALQRPLSSTLLFDYPTVRRLATFLAGGENRTSVTEADRIAQEVNSISDEEAVALLEAELTGDGDDRGTRH